MVPPLEDFRADEVAQLNALHPQPLADADVRRLYDLVGGHPYLTRKALYLVAVKEPTCSVDDLFARATEDSGPFGDHLRSYLLRLQRKPELIATLRQAVAHHSAEDELLIHRLQAAGLVRRTGNKVIARCDLYAKYFRERQGA